MMIARRIGFPVALGFAILWSCGETNQASLQNNAETAKEQTQSQSPNEIDTIGTDGADHTDGADVEDHSEKITPEQPIEMQTERDTGFSEKATPEKNTGQCFQYTKSVKNCTDLCPKGLFLNPPKGSTQIYCTKTCRKDADCPQETHCGRAGLCLPQCNPVGDQECKRQGWSSCATVAVPGGRKSFCRKRGL